MPSWARARQAQLTDAASVHFLDAVPFDLSREESLRLYVEATLSGSTSSWA